MLNVNLREQDFQRGYSVFVQRLQEVHVSSGLHYGDEKEHSRYKGTGQTGGQ